MPSTIRSPILCMILVVAAAEAVAVAAGNASQVPATFPRLEKLEVLADGHPLTVWAKRPASPRGVVVLLHGRTWSSLPNFDLQVEGHQRSVMDALSSRGYAAYALDQRGYGATPRDSSGWLTPNRAAADVAIVLRWIGAREGERVERPVLVGYSQGTLTALLTAQLFSDSLSKLVLYGFYRDLDEKVSMTDTPGLPRRERNTSAAFNFVTPSAQPRIVVESYVQQGLLADPIRADLRNDYEFNAVDPAKVQVPTLVIRGALDPLGAGETTMKLFSRLGTGDRSLVELPGSDHMAHVEDVQSAWVHAIVTFIERPRVLTAVTQP